MNRLFDVYDRCDAATKHQWTQTKGVLAMSALMVTIDEIREHFLNLKTILRLTPQELADMLGVARHTVYQYGFKSENRGAGRLRQVGVISGCGSGPS